MDAIDRDILTLLHQDGRLSHEEIAKRVHLSRPAVHFSKSLVFLLALLFVLLSRRYTNEFRKRW